MVTAQPTAHEVWKWLKEIADPEIPALSIVDLGIVRDVIWSVGGELSVTVTPTYSGCPAFDVIVNEIRAAMKQHGIEVTRIVTQLSPAWTTDWINEDAKERLRKDGIAPPPLVAIMPMIVCPHCGSGRTELVSRFGSAPCKALYKCQACLEPFDAFKRH